MSNHHRALKKIMNFHFHFMKNFYYWLIFWQSKNELLHLLYIPQFALLKFIRAIHIRFSDSPTLLKTGMGQEISCLEVLTYSWQEMAFLSCLVSKFENLKILSCLDFVNLFLTLSCLENFENWKFLSCLDLVNLVLTH